MNPSFSVRKVDQKNLGIVRSYLASREDTAQFLINNLREHGPNETTHHNSGNFKVIFRSEKVAAVFCLTRRGNLNVQSEEDFSDVILEECEKENYPLKGFIGDWESIAPVYQKFKEKRPEYRPQYESKEILYSYKLERSDAKLVHDTRVRFLQEKDFAQWFEFSKSYAEELSLPHELSVDQKRLDFTKQIQDKIWWGLFSGDEMLSRVALNSKGETAGQVGGVFTPVQYRKKGYAKAAMFHMLKDCRDIHGHTKNILFTGTQDIPAQKLYESMGYNRIGWFALILS